MNYLRFLLVSGHGIGWVLAIILIVLLPMDWIAKAWLMGIITILGATASTIQYRSYPHGEPRKRRR